MSWSNAYIGLPWADLGRTDAGADCWGLACLVYARELGIDLPAYQGISADDHAEIAALVGQEAARPRWTRIEGDAQPFDLAVFRRGVWASHVGIVIRPGLMLHMARGDCAKVGNYSQGPLKGRFVGHYRHTRN